MILAKASYWMAVGILALIVSNHLAGSYRDEGRCLFNRSLTAVEQISGQVTRYIATAEMMLGGSEARLVRAQTRLASVQTMLASHEAALAKVQAQREQLMELQQLRGTIVCSRQNLRIVIPRLHRDGTI
ncbi:MAG: hypothetical protein WB711_24550 [Terriglobales bacterium]